MKKLKIKDILWLIYELLIFPGYGILCWAIVIGYINIPHNYYFIVWVIILLFALPRFIIAGVFGSKPKQRLEKLLKLTI